VELSTKKARALLAYLAVESGRAHTRDQLATLLWGETGDERARHNLRQALSKIRQCSGRLVISRGDSLELDPTGCSADVLEFEGLAKSDDADELLACFALYRGDLLDGMLPREPGYDDWLLLARGRLRNTACDAVDRLVAALVAEGRIREAIDALERRLSMDPACEPAHCELMELLVGKGRRSDALRQYQTCVEALARELGAEPSAETKALYERIRRAESETGPEATRSSAAPVRQPESDLPTVAVLPFDNLSDVDNGYFVDGIVEDIITALSCFNSLLVIARGSTFVYRGRDVPDRQIADELGAQYLVRGSVQRAGDRVRINVQLLDARAGTHVWGHRFDHQMEDVFLVQDEITSTLVSTVAGRVEAARLAHARKAPPERLAAYDLLLRGKEHHHRFTADDCRACLDMFDHAIERDPDYALAHAWLACGLGQAMVFELDDNAALAGRSRAAAERGLALDENESECHRVLAQVHLTGKDLKRSLWHQERALFLNPNDDRSVCSMGEILTYLGRSGEGEEWVRKSMQLNPYHPQRYWTHLARALFHLERLAEALEALEHIGQLRRDDHGYRVAASARLGDAALVARNVGELREAYPEFDATAFVADLPYERESDRELIRVALKAALSDT
jgi:adenylate cyclase